MQTSDNHLVLQASPSVPPSLARAIDGPGWYAGAKVAVLRSLHLGKWIMREAYVSPSTNEGSIFAGHLVLVWTVGEHAYVLGFHRSGTLQHTRDMNQLVARSIQLIQP